MCIYHISSCYTGMYNLKKQQPLVLKLDDNIKQQMIWQACYKSDHFVMKKRDIYGMSRKILNYLPSTM